MSDTLDDYLTEVDRWKQASANEAERSDDLQKLNLEAGKWLKSQLRRTKILHRRTRTNTKSTTTSPRSEKSPDSLR